MASSRVSAEVVAFQPTRAPAACHRLLDEARRVSESAFAHGAEHDEDGAFPSTDIAALGERGLLVAPLPVNFGGAGLTGSALCAVLRTIGWGSLPLGRLFEGHVNALALVLGYGNLEQVQMIANEAEAKRRSVSHGNDF